MEMTTKVRKRGLAAGQPARRALNDAARETMLEAGELWHRDIRPKHFRNSATSEYGYAPRSGERGSNRPFKGSYTEGKLRKYGHTRPMVYSGESEEDTERNVTFKATATGKQSRVKVRMNARKLNFKNPRSRIDLRAELVRVSVRDREQVRGFVRSTHVRRLQNLQAQTTTIIN